MGSTEAIPTLLGREPDGRPWAEYWLGTHANGPTGLDDGTSLEEFIREHPETLGDTSRAEFGSRLPFLLKVLSAAGPQPAGTPDARTGGGRIRPRVAARHPAE
ncbi:hypothetical protein G7085_07420 [Tessaracoccus sp. HDW20]|nr:hypothetical protein [Tessaracoccus coleopterorum]